MKLLLDTRLLLWAANSPERLPKPVRRLLEDAMTEPCFSVASLWEIVIKRTLGRQDFVVEPATFRRGLLDNGYRELPVTGSHVLALDRLPLLHKDPFDRVLIAQALAEGIELLSADSTLARYGSPVRSI